MLGRAATREGVLEETQIDKKSEMNHAVLSMSDLCLWAMDESLQPADPLERPKASSWPLRMAQSQSSALMMKRSPALRRSRGKRAGLLKAKVDRLGARPGSPDFWLEDRGERCRTARDTRVRLLMHACHARHSEHSRSPNDHQRADANAVRDLFLGLFTGPGTPTASLCRLLLPSGAAGFPSGHSTETVHACVHAAMRLP